MDTQPLARTVGFKTGERNVFFHLLTACNLSCRHCYINPDQHGVQTLELETVLQWLRLFSDEQKQSNLILLGGEPTMHPDLPQIIKAAKAMGFAVTVDTNGFLFHDLLDKVTPNELDYLSFPWTVRKLLLMILSVAVGFLPLAQLISRRRLTRDLLPVLSIQFQVLILITYIECLSL